ncbi:MAG TPA: hypothetical protein V6D22_16680 [Candidatus Obscuribacterales bacterium]
MQARVSNLKQQFEHLFPGKWLTGAERSSNLQTGMPEIDKGITRGIARKRISEWVGPVSSGKTSLLKIAISNWCAAGLNVAYIDMEGKLFAADWAFTAQGKFWIVRPPDKNTISQTGTVVPLISKRALFVQEALWSADQFIRCNAFDVVVLDFGSANPSDSKKRGIGYAPVPSRIYARLQRSLDRSKAALIVVRDVASGQVSESWGANARFNFDWGTQINCEPGLAGSVMITPTIKCNVVKDGLSQTVEVTVGSSVQNRLFTHPQVPDRRTSKR